MGQHATVLTHPEIKGPIRMIDIRLLHNLY